MKKSLKGIVLASLISTQVLATPISALAVSTETSETPVAQTTEETIEEAIPSEEKEDTSAATEVPKQEESTEVTIEETDKTEETATSEEKTESSTSESKEKTTVAASEEKKQALKDLIASAWATLKSGTYWGETTTPLKNALEAATALVTDNKTTDAQLDAAMADISLKLTELKSVEEPELSFVTNLINAINDGTEIIFGQGFLGDKYTEASVNARREQINTALEAGKAVLMELYVNGIEIDSTAALANEAQIVAATNAILEAINGGTGLARTDMLKDVLLEASQLSGSMVPSEYLQDKTNFEVAFEQALNALDNALTNEEVQNAVNALRSAMDNLHLLVVVSAVDDNGNLIADQVTTSKIGLYKEAWTVEPPVVEGYEYVSTSVEPMNFAMAASTSALAGTYGDGTNDVTLVYKKTGLAEPLPLTFETNQITNQPATIGVNNHAKPLDPAKPTLPKTGEQTSAMTGFGIMALVGATLGFFKKRKIRE